MDGGGCELRSLAGDALKGRVAQGWGTSRRVLELRLKEYELEKQ